MMMDQWTDRLSDYMDGELTQDEAEALEAHLLECPECGRTLQELRAVVTRAQQVIDRPPVNDLWAGISARIAVVAPGFAEPAAEVLERETTLVVLIILPAILYLTLAARRAYGVARRHAILAAVFLSWWQIVLIVYFYRAPLFFTTFYSLRWFN